MENKVLIFVLLLLVVNVSLVSSADWDNTYDYDPETKTATVENWFGAGADLAYITLTSPNNVMVARGVDRLVGTFNFTTTGDFEDTFGDIYLEDVASDKEISRGKQFKYKKYTNISVDDYETICEDVVVWNGTEESCTQIEIGSHWEIKTDWIPISNPTNTFYEGVTYEVGVFVDVEAGDYGDWIPSIMGIEIKEWATWTESLNVGLFVGYNFDEQDTSGTGKIIDILNNNNGTNAGTTNTTGIIQTAYDYDSDYINIPNDQFEGLGTFSMSYWIFPDTGDAGIHRAFREGSFYTGYDNNRIAVFFDTSGVDCSVGASSGITGGSWYHVLFSYNGTGLNLYLDGVSIDNVSCSGGIASLSENAAFGARDDGSPDQFWEGKIDKAYFWNRSVSASEVEQLYNSGDAITFINIFEPQILIIFPENITYNETITELNYNVDAGDRCWFSDNGGTTNSSDVPAGTNFTGLLSVPLENNWTVFCNNSNFVGSDTVTFFVNQSSQTELIAPADGANSTITLINFAINSTPTNTNLSNVTLYIWHINETLLSTNITSLSGDVEVQTNFTPNLTQGNFIWNAETCGLEGGCLFADDNRTLTVHTTPSSVVIHFPNETINFLEAGGNLTLNWTISEPGQNLTEHIINCSYLYNGVTTGLNKSQCIEINETSFLYIDGFNNLSFTVLEEFGLTTTNFTTWDFLFEKYNVTFDNQTFEGTQEIFTAEIILSGGASITQAIFYYNDTNYTTSIISSGGEYVVVASITIPLVEEDTNFSLGFYIVIEGTTYNLDTFTQEVLSINFSACGTRNDTVLNMSLFNEETKVSILGDIEINAQAISKTSGDITASINISFVNVSYGAICMSPLEAYSNLYFSSEIRYVASDFVPEFYYIQMADMADYPRNLSLFDLAINDSTEFLVTYQDDSLIPTEGAIIQLQRKYIAEDAFEVVEAPLTSNAGTAVLHIDLNTNRYRASVVKDGVLLDFFNNIVFDCENELSGECTELLLGSINPQNNIPLTNLTDFVYSISSVNNTITTTFIVPSGTPSTVNVVLTQLDQFGNETTCNQTVISSAGTIDCTFVNTIGDSFLSLKISKDAELQAQQTYIVVEDSTLNFLGNNFFILIIIMLSLVGMAISSPEWMIINAVMVMLIGGAFWLVNGMNFVMGLGSLVWLVISAIILIIKLAKQEDR